MAQNQRQLRNYEVATLIELKAIADATIKTRIWCAEQETLYIYVVDGSTYTANDEEVCTTGVGGDTRWIGIAGVFIGKHAQGDFAEMWLNNNAVATVVATADTPIAISDFTTGLLNEFTFQAGTRGEDIVSYATYDEGASTLVTTTADHGLSDGDFITISNTTNYNAVYEILSAPTTKTFEIDKAWDTNDDAQGYYDRGSCFTAGAMATGTYQAHAHLSSSVGGAANDTVKIQTYINKSLCPKCIGPRKFVTNDQGNLIGGSYILVTAGDKIWLSIMNSGTDNITNQYGNFRMHRI